RVYLGEDVELGRRVRAAGYRVALGRPVLRTAPRHLSFSAAVDRFARWLAVVRLQRPALLASYPLVFAATTPALALAFTLPDVGVQGHVAGLVLLVARAVVFTVGRGLAGLPRGPLAFVVDLVLADVVLWAALCRSLSARAVHWRGRVLAFDDRGRLIDDARAATLD
ncbi:MAG TPA: glycosyltransferase, partial [Nannocystis sp.]